MRTIAIFAVFFLPPAANAQFRCGTHSCAPSYSYSYPTYSVVERVREVIIPVFAYPSIIVDPRITYYYGSVSVPQAVVQPQVQVQPQSVPQTMPANPAPSVPSYSNDQLDNLLDLLEKRLRDRTLKTTNGPPGVPGYTPVSYNNGAESQETSPRNYVNVLAENCAKCHTEGRLKNNDVVLFANGKIHPSWNAQQAWDAIAGGRMPLAGQPRISPTDMNILRRDFGLTN